MRDDILDTIIEKEYLRQRDSWNLIASENLSYFDSYIYNNSVLTNKYAEGTCYNRFYEGCQNINEIELLAIDRAQNLYNMPYANVQPHCGSSANLIAYLACLSKGDTVLSMGFNSGGHLSHGHPKNISALLYNFIFYEVDPISHEIDYNVIEELLKKHKPRLLISGASSYSRLIDYKIMFELARKYNAIHMVDMAHLAGLIAAKVIPSPSGYADIITSTTHKTLRGPRSGFILSTEQFAKKIDLATMPGLQGGPFMHTIAAKAWLFKYALSIDFIEYQKNILINCQIMINALKEKKIEIITGGSDNHLFVVNLESYNKTGKEVANQLSKENIFVNKNIIPYDKKGVFITSGIRIGTPFITAQGKSQREIISIAHKIINIIICDA